MPITVGRTRWRTFALMPLAASRARLDLVQASAARVRVVATAIIGIVAGVLVLVCCGITGIAANRGMVDGRVRPEAARVSCAFSARQGDTSPGPAFVLPNPRPRPRHLPHHPGGAHSAGGW